MAKSNDNSLVDDIASLVDAYEALEQLAGDHEPVHVLLCNLNRQLRGLCDLADGRGLLT